jgi:lactate racemase
VSECFAGRALSGIDPAKLTRRAPEPAPKGLPLRALCRDALRAPVESPPLESLARQARRIAVIISDASRDEPRAEMLDALFRIVPRDRVRIVVASGTHVGGGSVVPEPYRDLPSFVHDSTRLEQMVALGTTERGTPVRLLREVADADLVVVTGRIRPHYFAGFSGGTKGIFPGVADRDGALANHLLKADLSARLGRVDDNVCRLDMEQAALRIRGVAFVLNVLADVEGNAVAAAAGHPIAAHRALLGRARELFTIRAPRSRVVVVADRPPVTSSLYQASKLLPPAAALLEPGGTVIVVAECDQGTGPLDRVNQGIYELGVARQLPPGHRVVLVSMLAPEIVRRTYAEPAASLSEALDRALSAHATNRAVLLWRAGECIAEPEPA